MAKEQRGLCIMFCEDMQYDKKVKPIFAYVCGKDVVMTDFDTFMDAGFQYEYRIIPIGEHPPREEKKDAYWAYDYFYEGCDSGELGWPSEPFEDEHRRKHFAALWEFLAGEIVIFKEG